MQPKLEFNCTVQKCLHRHEDECVAYHCSSCGEARSAIYGHGGAWYCLRCWLHKQQEGID